VKSISRLSKGKTIDELARYEISGRIAYSSTPTKLHTRFFWKHDQLDKLIFLDPFGNTQLVLTIENGRIVFVSRAYEGYIGSNVESLVFISAGISIPLGELYQLLTNILDYSVHRSLCLQQEPMKLSFHESQHHWSFSLGEYRKYGDLLLPSELALEHKKIGISIHINDWAVS
jgi:outer membrane lipoprotein LolB